MVLDFPDNFDYSVLSSLVDDDSKEITLYLSTNDVAEFLKVRIKLRPPCYFARDTRDDGNG